MEIKSMKKRAALRQTPSPAAAVCGAVLCIVLSAFAQDKLLIIRAGDTSFVEAVRGLTDELGAEYTHKELIISSETLPDAIGKVMNDYAPNAVVLMDNRAIRLYRLYCNATPNALKIPSISLMAVFIDKEIQGLENSAAISYEIPIVISAVNLRSVSGKDVHKIGIVYRQFMAGYIEENKKFCEKEGISLVCASTPDLAFDRFFSLRKILRNLLDKEKVDALWVPNDNVLLNATLIRDVWQPMLRKHKVSVIVGVKNLANPDIEFGTFAVTPDHVSLGAQAAELVREARNNGWRFDKSFVQPPISVVKTLNLRKTKTLGDIGKKALEGIDFILE